MVAMYSTQTSAQSYHSPCSRNLTSSSRDYTQPLRHEGIATITELQRLHRRAVAGARLSSSANEGAVHARVDYRQSSLAKNHVRLVPFSVAACTGLVTRILTAG